MPEKNAEKNAILPSTLYLVATPIGNLEDMTFRAVKVLEEVQLIAAEDTRNTLKLLNHFKIPAPKMISCFEHNEAMRVGDVLKALEEGKAVALVTDAGMPGISDPGDKVVKEVIQRGFRVVPVPGASSILASLPVSGFVTTPFTFLGFLPSKTSERRSALLGLRSEERTLVFFESPHRLRNSLKDMMNVFGNRQAMAGRELTKLHEQFVRGTLQDLWKHFKTNEPMGEFVIVIEGGERVDHTDQEKWVGVSIADQLMEFIKVQGLSKTEAVKAVSRMRGLPREVVYKIATEIPVEEMAASKDDAVEEE